MLYKGLARGQVETHFIVDGSLYSPSLHFTTYSIADGSKYKLFLQVSTHIKFNLSFSCPSEQVNEHFFVFESANKEKLLHEAVQNLSSCLYCVELQSSTHSNVSKSASLLCLLQSATHLLDDSSVYLYWYYIVPNKPWLNHQYTLLNIRHKN